jgi:hypothetical protein
MGKLVTFLVPIIELIVKNLTPELKTMLSAYIKELYVKAKATGNQFDDIAVVALAALFGVDLD